MLEFKLGPKVDAINALDLGLTAQTFWPPNHGDREPSRVRIRSSTSGFTRTGPHCGPCPTTNSRKTTNDLSRSRRAFSVNREWLTGPAVTFPAAAARADWFK